MLTICEMQTWSATCWVNDCFPAHTFQGHPLTSTGSLGLCSHLPSEFCPFFPLSLSRDFVYQVPWWQSPGCSVPLSQPFKLSLPWKPKGIILPSHLLPVCLETFLMAVCSMCLLTEQRSFRNSSSKRPFEASSSLFYLYYFRCKLAVI